MTLPINPYITIKAAAATTSVIGDPDASVYIYADGDELTTNLTNGLSEVGVINKIAYETLKKSLGQISLATQINPYIKIYTAYDLLHKTVKVTIEAKLTNIQPIPDLGANFYQRIIITIKQDNHNDLGIIQTNICKVSAPTTNEMLQTASKVLLPVLTFAAIYGIKKFAQVQVLGPLAPALAVYSLIAIIIKD